MFNNNDNKIKNKVGGSTWSAITDPNSAASEGEKPAESDRRREERRECTKLQKKEEERLVTNIFERQGG